MTSNRDRKLPVEAAAASIGIAPRTLRDWIKRKLIKAVRMNPHAKHSPHLIPQSEIDRIEELRDAEAGHAARST